MATINKPPNAENRHRLRSVFCLMTRGQDAVDHCGMHAVVIVAQEQCVITPAQCGVAHSDVNQWRRQNFVSGGTGLASQKDRKE